MLLFTSRKSSLFYLILLNMLSFPVRTDKFHDATCETSENEYAATTKKQEQKSSNFMGSNNFSYVGQFSCNCYTHKASWEILQLIYSYPDKSSRNFLLILLLSVHLSAHDDDMQILLIVHYYIMIILLNTFCLFDLSSLLSNYRIIQFLYDSKCSLNFGPTFV